MSIIENKNAGKIGVLQPLVKQMSFIYQRRLKVFERAVRQAERKLSPLYPPAALDRDGLVSFDTNCPRGAAYAASPSGNIFEAFKKVPSPEKRSLVDCGSGLGLPCFIASLLFKDATGVELDHRLFIESEKIRRKLKINNVRFENMDFLEADLRKYDAIFMHWPFYEDFSGLMSAKLKETRPGTFIISHRYGKKDIFSPKDYRLIYADISNFITSDFTSGTFVFERK